MKELESIGPYQIIGFIGRGGMASVYRAEGPDGREVAVKVMLEKYDGRSEFTERFRRECRAAASLRHPNIVALYDFGISRDRPYAVMEYVPGRTLDDELKKVGSFPLKKLLELARSLLEACVYYYAKGFVHRDLKPSNIFLRPSGRPVIGDFGLVYDSGLTSITKTGALVGTPAYMPPEAGLGEKLDISADLFELGLIFFECLTGERAFETKIPCLLTIEQLREKARSLTRLRPDLPEPVAAFVANLCCPDRKLRYNNPEQALNDLKLAQGGSDVGLLDPDCPFLDGSRRGNVRGRITAPGLRRLRDTKMGGGRKVRNPSIVMWFGVGRFAGLRKSLVAVIIVLLVAAAFYGFWRLAGPDRSLGKSAVFPRPRVHMGFNEILLSWKSPAKVRCKALLESPKGKIIEVKQERDACVEHSFRFRPGCPGLPQAWLRIGVLPDGPVSKALKVNCKPFSVRMGDLKYASDRVTIRLDCSRRIENAGFSLEIRDKSGRKTWGECTVVRRTLTCRLPQVGPALTELILTAGDEQSGENLRIDLAQAYREWIERMLAPCRRIDMRTRLTLITKKAGSQVEKQREIREKDWVKALQRSADACAVVLTSPLLSLGRRASMYEILKYCALVDHMLRSKSWPGICDGEIFFGEQWSGCWLGDSHAGSGREVILGKWIQNGRKRVITGFGMALVSLDKELVSRRFRFKADSGMLADVEKALVYLHIPSLPKRLCLNISVNDWPAKLLVVNRIGTANYQRNAGDWFRQSIPAGFINEGENEMLVRGDLVPGYLGCDDNIVMDQVHLVLVRGGR